MSCSFPMQAYLFYDEKNRKEVKILDRTSDPRDFGSLDSCSVKSIYLPCGKCLGCRIKRSKEWAIRCVHEASLYTHNCFITLTYNDEHLPKDLSLNHDHFRRFMKRLRLKYGPEKRYFQSGEYGEARARPHFHALLFNFDFPDKKYWKTVRKNDLYISDSLTDLWSYGHCVIGSVTFQSAAYIARYLFKKVFKSDKKFEEHYGKRKPEYVTMSRNPGIGKGWFDKFYTDIYPSDFIIHDGKKQTIPRFYDKLLEEKDNALYEKVKWSREINAKEQKKESLRKMEKYFNKHDYSDFKEFYQSRKITRETVLHSKYSMLQRTID
ncbi:replication initiator protein [Microviridae sp.]|nr:replication initiator protein [Microviridae sp.]